ncbi:MAG: hypothetical protein LBP70_01760 [Mycoplasmataceae bacterium]|jgi:hypothetical protein|nr:hypothetical protein [Mycoplasmataceae bacterium]
MKTNKIKNYKLKKQSEKLSNKIVGFSALKEHKSFANVIDEQQYIKNIIKIASVFFINAYTLNKYAEHAYLNEFINFYKKQLLQIGITESMYMKEDK